MSLPTPRALPEQAMDFGPAPRLRSLRIVEESRETNSAEGLTPSLRLGSLAESEKSPLHFKLGNADTHQRHANTRSDSSRWSWRPLLLVVVVMMCLGALAMAYISSRRGADSGIVAIESLHTAQHTLGREVGATLSSHHSVAKGDTFVASVMKPTQSSGHRVLVKDETVADSVAGLYDVFKEDDITASTSGEDVREQQHGGSGSVGESEEVEDNAEVGFFMTSSEERKLEGKSHTEAQADEGQKGSLVHQGVNLKVSNASSSSNPAQQLSREHLRIFVADLGPKYNLEIFEALHGIDDSTAEALSSKDLLDAPLNLQKGAELLDVPSHHLDVVLHSLVTTSPLRTDNASEADIVWVPFWVHKLVRLDQEIEKPNKYDLAQVNFWNDVDHLLPLLGKKPHVIVVPGQESELRSTCGGFGIGFLCHHRASELTVLSPEVFLKKKDLGLNDGISIAVPDVANVRVKKVSLLQKFDRESFKSMKTKLISEAFRSRAPIRKALKTQCLADPKQCSHAEPSSRLSSTAFSKVVHENDKAAWFSLQPPGDTNVRLPFFNCLLSGAIPVAFDPKLHSLLPFSSHVQWEDILVQVSAENINSQRTLIADVLKDGHSMEARLSRLAKIHGIRGLMQYESKPNISSVRFDVVGVWAADDDAFSMALKTLMQTLCHHKRLPAERCSGQERHLGHGN